VHLSSTPIIVIVIIISIVILISPDPYVHILLFCGFDPYVPVVWLKLILEYNLGFRVPR